MSLFENLASWGAPLLATLFVAFLAGWTLQRIVPWRSEQKVLRQITLLALVLLTLLAVPLVLPFGETTRGQLLSLMGLIVTAVIALASTTSASNVMAGLVLRGIGGFRPGDFIRVGNQFGRVTVLGLLHTEIQSEDRDLITLPNLYVVTNPVKVVHSSGTLISADVAIGYDVHRRQVAELLNSAAEAADLRDPFVLITELGDFAVHYRVSGFLSDVGNIVSKRSRLKAKILDSLHDASVEVMTPTVMAQRPLTQRQKLIPADELSEEQVMTGHAEQMMFDKADIALRIEQLTEQRTRLLEEMASSDTVSEGKTDWRQQQVDALDKILATLNNPVK